MDLGKALKTVRLEKRLKQMKAADMAGITQTYLSLIESNQREPSMEVLKNICAAYGTTMPVLMWFAITESDVDKSKVKIFKSLKAPIDNLIKEFI